MKKCDFCGKNDALIHVQQINNGEVKEIHLCEACAREKGIIQNAPGEEQASLSNMIGRLVGNLFEDSEQEIDEVLPDHCCESCGMSKEDLLANQQVGCPECYHHFRTYIKHILQKPYKGRVPQRLKAYKTVLFDKRDLKRQLKEAVAREEYERAARIRDAIERIDDEV